MVTWSFNTMRTYLGTYLAAVSLPGKVGKAPIYITYLGT